MKNNQFRPPLNQNNEVIQYASQQIRQVLILLGVEFRDTGKWLLGACRVHNGDNSSAFNYNLDKNYWCCRTRSCQIDHGKDIVGLVAGIKGVSRDAALDWLVEHVPECELVQRKIVHVEDKIYPDSILKRLLRSDYYLKKGFREETVNHFFHGIAESGNMRRRVVFPIRNEKGFIVGFSGRWAGQERLIDGKTVCFSGERVVAKWKHTSFKKSQYLYNFDDAQKYCEKEIIIVESIGNAMRWFDCGFRNVVACLGSSVSSKQSSMIIGRTNKVVLAFDNDPAGQKAAENNLKRFEKYVNTIVLMPPEGKDWGDLTNEQVKELYGKEVKN